MASKSVIFYTLQTCGTGSSWRILRILADDQRILRDIGEEQFAKGEDFSFQWSEIPVNDHLIKMNCFYFLPPIDNFDGKRFIVNFRDPRDRLCNEFMWTLSHPLDADDTKEKIEARAARHREMGIDAWLKTRIERKLADDDYYQYFVRNAERIPVQDRIVNSYARLCLDFDSFVERAAAWLDVELTPAVRQTLESERTENIQENPEWSGHFLEGADTAPGRYTRELKPESIAFLSEYYAPVLRAMARLDPDYANLYLENVADDWGLTPFPQKLSFQGQLHYRDGIRKAPPKPTPVVAGPDIRRKIFPYTLSNRAGLRIEHFRPEVKSGMLAFIFISRAENEHSQSLSAIEILLKNGWDALVIETSRNWQEAFSDRDIADIERWLSWASMPYARRLAFGAGTAGDAAIRLSKRLRFDRVVALSPQSDGEQIDSIKPVSPTDPIGDGGGLSDTTEYVLILGSEDHGSPVAGNLHTLIAADRLKILQHPLDRYFDHLTQYADAALQTLDQDKPVPAVAA